MMNVVFLCLLLTSLVTRAMWSPSPRPHHHVIVKEGHQVVVVEFGEEREGSTKVLISQHEDGIGAGGNLGGAEGRRSGVVEDAAKARFTGPRELFGKCRHKLARALGMTKNVVSRKAHEVSSKARNFEGHVKEAVDEAVGKVGDPKGKLSEKLSEKLKRLEKRPGRSL